MKVQAASSDMANDPWKWYELRATVASPDEYADRIRLLLRVSHPTSAGCRAFASRWSSLYLLYRRAHSPQLSDPVQADPDERIRKARGELAEITPDDVWDLISDDDDLEGSLLDLRIYKVEQPADYSKPARARCIEVIEVPDP